MISHEIIKLEFAIRLFSCGSDHSGPAGGLSGIWTHNLSTIACLEVQALPRSYLLLLYYLAVAQIIPGFRQLWDFRCCIAQNWYLSHYPASAYVIVIVQIVTSIPTPQHEWKPMHRHRHCIPCSPVTDAWGNMHDFPAYDWSAIRLACLWLVENSGDNQRVRFVHAICLPWKEKCC